MTTFNTIRNAVLTLIIAASALHDASSNAQEGSKRTLLSPGRFVGNRSESRNANLFQGRPLGRVGEITGIISWSRFDIPSTVLSQPAPVAVEASSRTVSPGTKPGEFGRTVDKPITGVTVTFEKITSPKWARGSYYVRYSVKNVPLRTSVVVKVHPTQSTAGGYFIASHKQGGTCTVETPTIAECDFHFSPLK